MLVQPYRLLVTLKICYILEIQTSGNLQLEGPRKFCSPGTSILWPKSVLQGVKEGEKKAETEGEKEQVTMGSTIALTCASGQTPVPAVALSLSAC